MTSVSEVDWKIEPAASSSWRRIVGVHQVAVVADGDRAAVALDQVRLRVRGHGVARGRVAHVADRPVPGERVEPLRREHVVHQAHALLEADPRPVARRDARRLLAAVLQGVEPHVGEVRGLGVAEDAEEAALVVEVVVLEGQAAERRRPGSSGRLMSRMLASLCRPSGRPSVEPDRDRPFVSRPARLPRPAPARLRPRRRRGRGGPAPRGGRDPPPRDRGRRARAPLHEGPRRRTCRSSRTSSAPPRRAELAFGTRPGGSSGASSTSPRP